MPNIRWQPSDLADKLPGIRQWIAESGCTNIADPLELDISARVTPDIQVSDCYTANTLHIVSWPHVVKLFSHAAKLLDNQGSLFAYGPFKVNAQHTSEGNRQFDEQLRASEPTSGIRHLEDLNELAVEQGMKPADRIQMPANNFLLRWKH